VRIGIFGTAKDPQCHAIAREAKALGADNVFIDSSAFEKGLPLRFEGGSTYYRNVCLDDLCGYYLRAIPSAYAPAVQKDEELVLYKDWFEHYMRTRERATYYLAWLLKLQHDGKVLVNPPHAGTVLQYKPYQLHVLERLGAQVPRTLITNDPEAVRTFYGQVKDVIYKPVTGGAITQTLNEESLARLELIKAAPVIFQERAPGDDLRVMLVGDEIVSCVAIETPDQHLDFRADPVYSGGAAKYREVTLPEPVQELCRKAARACELRFAGIDIKHVPGTDRWVFLELNSSPIYLDVELKLGHPISKAIAKMTLSGARA
jgi:glutathione synthase/RimK-type ligase-like ATP-grasp enzyme